jgi:hypothetical protein
LSRKQAPIWPLDLLKLARLPFAAAIAMVAPPRLWPPLTRLMAMVREQITPRERDRSISQAPPFLAELMSCSPAEVYRSYLATHYDECLHVLRANLLGGYEPGVRLERFEHIEAALAQGRGVILWITVTPSSSLVVKIALNAAGLDVTHLSRPDHGFSGSRFGIRYLNPIRTRIEDRYLRERLLLDEGRTIGVLRTLRERLSQNGVVTITVATDALQQGEVPLFGGVIPVATGPAHLACTTGAALLPVFSIQTGDDFRVVVQPPLPVQEGLGRPDAVADLLRQYGARLEAFVSEHPHMWCGWLTYPPAPWRPAAATTRTAASELEAG